jgi:hypothetical protein
MTQEQNIAQTPAQNVSLPHNGMIMHMSNHAGLHPQHPHPLLRKSA